MLLNINRNRDITAKKVKKSNKLKLSTKEGKFVINKQFYEKTFTDNLFGYNSTIKKTTENNVEVEKRVVIIGEKEEGLARQCKARIFTELLFEVYGDINCFDIIPYVSNDLEPNSQQYYEIIPLEKRIFKERVASEKAMKALEKSRELKKAAKQSNSVQ
jgi:hypothetical protein